MRQSEIFTKTRKEAPSDEEARNAQLLIRGGFIHKEMAGVYSFLPLGLRVLRKIENIVREEINAIGGQEILMTTLQDPEIWKKSGRWVEEGDDPDSGLPWFKTELTSGGELGIANTHEEALSNILSKQVSSYKDLPLYAYQIQNKFRNELRAKSGILRGREFLMKDLYSFSRTKKEFDEFYEKCAKAYMKIFERVGLGDVTHRTFASGGAFSKFSDEFQTETDAGEDIIYLDSEKRIAVNKEVYTDEVLKELGLRSEDLVEKKAIEVGNIFSLGTKYAEALDLKFKDDDGKDQFPVMGSYGIGISRLMGAVVEVHNDSLGIKWTVETAPFLGHIVSLSQSGEALEYADSLYNALKSKGLEILYDDREKGAGEKLSDADLIGIPYRIIVSDKSLRAGGVEVKMRWEEEARVMDSGKVEGLMREFLE